ncbi:acyl-CoA dehydrogenase NM domain-like protein [Cantharellus anzutake]|uniref:acyl-CoA dehydrogenase NM domain-like protein n=1 Tax=Cantharellus anzutake TaxID=1750568 RepID=UPI001904FD50|nr:acyl-CoA dehydrogenase NM domain-like protein [Cantharellus anzutake]KAF8340593.1 acyl-CoA dehydrogenase NM domain-like protein [Cantharellus anzutake]
MSKQLKSFTVEEVAKHDKPDDLWIIIDSKVFDLTKFINLHPGGKSVLIDPSIAGKDATDAFFSLHRHEVLLTPRYARLQIGFIEGQSEQILPPRTGEISRVPYAEPTWLSEGFKSPYYKESHWKLQKVIREFVDGVLKEEALVNEENGKRPGPEIIQKAAELNLHAMRLGPGKHLKGRVLAKAAVTPEEFDYFHELIITQELVRIGTRGYGDGFQGGMVIGLPPVINFGSPELKAKVVPDVLAGKKFISLAISEAFAGSDVAGLKCTANKSEDGKYFTINGTKKWITNGTFSDYFTVACNTGQGLTVFLVERQEGVETKPIKTSYSSAAGTAYITFDNVKVPAENMLGPENGGLLVVLSNFNHERWVMCGSSARSQRSIVEECLKWCHQRQVFGKPLLNQPVIRHKLAAMIARVESVQNWLENVTYQMCHMNYKQQSNFLAGQIAFLKMYCTQTAQQTAQDATQIFGGRGITQTGMGRKVEHYHRTVGFDALLGGAEDVLGDLGVRQAVRKIPKNTRL